MNKGTLELELKEYRKQAEEILDHLSKGNLSASEFDQLLAEHNNVLLKYNKIETELLLIGVAPSKRTKRLESILRERKKSK